MGAQAQGPHGNNIAESGVDSTPAAAVDALVMGTNC
jgi:hypothetical protein